MGIGEDINVNDVPLDEIDVSRPEIFLNDNWQPWFERLRKEAPVHYLADSVNGPFWSVTSHEMIKAVDTNNEIFSSEAKGIAIVDPYVAEEGQMQGKNFISMDGDEHIKQRMAVAPTVAPKNLAGFEPLIRERASDILDNLPIGETFNWVEEVSIELTARMLATLFDFPYEERRKLVHWSDLATNVPEVTGDDSIDMKERYDELMGAAAAFYQLWMAKQGQPPSFDLISMLQHNEATARMNEDPELFLGNLLLLIVGGNDTTRNSISGGVLALNKYPDQYQKLRENPDLIPNMVAEIVRWQTPVIHMRRTALADIELGGKKIKEGDKVVMWYLSGNRDESVFEDPEKFIIDRTNARAHVAFGFGVHRCMGNRLAEMQLCVLWEEIMKRYDRVEIVGDVERLPNNFIRGIKDVPVRLHRV
ncbi:MAG: cytochrome P450 [Gammaproteobacteria bacterium]|nr:cytochrome P450 [Gammaproteobacteria bacterium]MBT5725518.1 cytochrome P450 [Gammaproteobacteria bacterium]MBT6582793.1 cytochrome P450 [Gammaproteobacteria bacterium]